LFQLTKNKIIFVSAYVCGEPKGLVEEEPSDMAETLNGFSRLNINTEKLFAEEKLKELKAEKASEQTITSVMKNLGNIRCCYIFPMFWKP